MPGQSHLDSKYQATIDLALIALKSAITINGAAAIAILAFWGNVLGNLDSNINSPNIANALGKFALGVLAGGLATAIAYLSQRLFLNDDESIWGKILNGFGVCFVFAAYVLFYYGIIQCQESFTK